jgi:predicted dehydrogenase
MPQQLKVAIAGLGFIGQVHVRAARAAGAQVVGVSGGHADHTRAVADRLGVDHVYETSQQLVTDPGVDIVHICTPNHLHQPLAMAALNAGKHVICEKPLATNAADAEDLVRRAASAGVVAAVPFVYRFHPMVREARDRIARGRTGSIHLLHGSYQQDWLASPDDYNWRVDPALGGTSRAFADIGAHWCDLVEFVSGHRIAEVSARTITAIPERLLVEHESFERTVRAGERVHVTGEDAVTMMFRTDRGAAGTLVVSQVSLGHKNALVFEVDASDESLLFDQEHADFLVIGKRESREVLSRDPNILSPAAARYCTLPAGHGQGYSDAFNAFVGDVYAAVRDDVPDGLPTFVDGLHQARLTEVVFASARDDTWKEVPA